MPCSALRCSHDKRGYTREALGTSPAQTCLRETPFLYLYFFRFVLPRRRRRRLRLRHSLRHRSFRYRRLAATPPAMVEMKQLAPVQKQAAHSALQVPNSRRSKTEL